MPVNFFDSIDFVLPIIHTEADYKKPLKPGDKIICEIGVGSLRDSSFELNYTFRIGNELHAEVKTVHVCTSKKDFSKTTLPDFLRTALSAHLIQ